MTDHDTIARAAASLDDPDAVMPEPPAPERIWLRYDGTATTDDPRPWETNPYVRADLIPAMLQETRNEAIREAARAAGSVAAPVAGTPYSVGGHLFSQAILALIDTPAPPTPAEPAGDALREALFDTLDAIGAMSNPHELCALGIREVDAMRYVALAAAPAPQPACCLCDDRPQAQNNPCGACGKTAQQPAPADREALVEVIYRAGKVVDYTRAEAIADALIDRGLRLSGEVQPTMRDETVMEHVARDIREGRFPKRSPRRQVSDTTAQPETLAWVVVGKDGKPIVESITTEKIFSPHYATAYGGNRVVRVSIRVVEDEA